MPKEVGIIKSFHTKKSPGSNGYSEEFYYIFEKELRIIFLKLIHKLKTEGTL